MPSSAQSVGGLTMTATSGTLATTNMLITAAALLVDVRVNTATTTITPTISAYIGQGDTVNVTGNVTVAATSSLAEGHANAQSYGGGGRQHRRGRRPGHHQPGRQGLHRPGLAGHRRRRHQRHLRGDDQSRPRPPHRYIQSRPQPSTPRPTRSRSPPTWATARSPVPGRHQPDPDRRPRQRPDHVERRFVPSQSGRAHLPDNGHDWAAAGFTPGVVFNVTTRPTRASTTVRSRSRRSPAQYPHRDGRRTLDSASNPERHFTLNRVYRIMNPSYTATGLAFANSPSGNTITRTAGSWVADGFVAGETDHGQRQQ